MGLFDLIFGDTESLSDSVVDAVGTAARAEEFSRALSVSDPLSKEEVYGKDDE